MQMVAQTQSSGASLLNSLRALFARKFNSDASNVTLSECRAVLGESNGRMNLHLLHSRHRPSVIACDPLVRLATRPPTLRVPRQRRMVEAPCFNPAKPSPKQNRASAPEQTSLHRSRPTPTSNRRDLEGQRMKREGACVKTLRKKPLASRLLFSARTGEGA